MSVNIPLLFLASILPDIDLLVPGIEHRGPTHSLIIFCFLFLPAFTLYGKRAIPYFIALLQHALIGDYLVGGTQLLWPITLNEYGLRITITSLTNIIIEWAFFLSFLIVLIKTKDVSILFKHNPSNLVLSIPLLTVILPTFFNFPSYVPYGLVPPHLVCLALFLLSIFTDFKKLHF